VGLAFGLDAVAAGNPIGPTVAIPTLVAGAIGGWVIGPSALRASSLRPRIIVILKLAMLALLVGAAVEGRLLAFGTPYELAPEGAELVEVPFRFMVGLWLAVVGLVFLGLFVAPISLLAAWIWVAAMARVGRRDRVAAVRRIANRP
jgi:hypothetical protein